MRSILRPKAVAPDIASRIATALRRSRKTSSLVAIVALVHGALIGTAMAVHFAEHDHDGLSHDGNSTLAILMHGHDHEPGTPEHRHPVVSAKPAAQQVQRIELPRPPVGASHADSAFRPGILSSVRLQPELCGPSQPLLGRSLVVLRI